MRYASVRRQRGFTLIELLVVITVIAILALIVTPRLMGAVRKSRESTLKGNLHQLRQAVAQFESDTGVFPATLDDVIQPDAATVTATIPPDSYKGPYLRRDGGIAGDGIPKNPFADQQSAVLADHWAYDDTDGTVGVPAGQAALATLDDGILFSEL
jgi:type II secretion system protein G